MCRQKLGVYYVNMNVNLQHYFYFRICVLSKCKVLVVLMGNAFTQEYLYGENYQQQDGNALVVQSIVKLRAVVVMPFLDLLIL